MAGVKDIKAYRNKLNHLLRIAERKYYLDVPVEFIVNSEFGF